MDDLIIREASPEDIDEICRVEQHWHPQGRATREKLTTRIAKFPQGFFVATLSDAGMSRMVATICAMPLHYDSSRLTAFSSWAAVTNDGYYPDHAGDLPALLHLHNALYIVSGIVDPASRGRDLFAPMVGRVVERARSLGLDYVLAGAVLPGYRRYCEQRGEVSAYAYCRMRRGSSPVDPLLAMYERVGFCIPGPDHVIPEYFPDDASRNYAAVVVRDLRAGAGVQQAGRH